MRPRTSGSCSTHRIAVPDRASPSSRSRDRAGARRVELGGRLIEDEHVGAHRDDARDRHALLLAARQGERLAVGQVGDRRVGRGRRRSGRPSRRARRPRFSRPNASSSRTVSFEADSWFAGVANTIPTRPRSRSAGGGLRVGCRRSSPCRPSVARTTRGMNPAAARASVDLPAPVRPATPTRSPAATDDRDVASGSGRAGRGSGPAGRRSAAARSVGRRASVIARSRATVPHDDRARSRR